MGIRGPYKPRKDLKKIVLACAVSEEQKKNFYELAEKRGLSVSSYLRELILDHLDKHQNWPPK